MRLFPNARRAREKIVQGAKGKRILDISCEKNKVFGATSIGMGEHRDIDHDLSSFPWPIEDNAFDLVVCRRVIEHFPNTVGAMEEMNRIVTSGGKVFIETLHYTCFQTFRHHEHNHQFSVSSFDYFLKGNLHYRTDFKMIDRQIFFDDLTYTIGVGFFANAFPRFYEKKLAFIFPATSFYVTLLVEKEGFVPNIQHLAASTMA